MVKAVGGGVLAYLANFKQNPRPYTYAVCVVLKLLDWYLKYGENPNMVLVLSEKVRSQFS